MCRLGAYLGKDISLNRFFSGSEHSLVAQAYQPKEMQGALLNADGFGIGWYDGNGTAVSYRQTLPAWSDTNLQGLGTSLSRPLWVANVRSATPGQLVHIGNTQPFIRNNLQFLHNGFIEGFQDGIKEKIIPLIDPDILAHTPGDTDSGWIATLFHQQLKADADIKTALLRTCDLLSVIVAERKALLNIIVCDGTALYAVRHAINGDSPSLYTLVDGNDFPDSVIIASEPFDEDPLWSAVGDHQFIGVDTDHTVHFVSLD